MTNDDKRQREADAILNRVAAESGGARQRTWADRALRHFTAASDTSGDQVEVWGIRVARALSAVFIVGMIIMVVRIVMG